MPAVFLDVRSRREFDAGHVPGARHIPFWAVAVKAAGSGIPRDAEIVVYCGHGPRARIARAILRMLGFRRVSLLAGHMRRWRREGRPLE